MATVTKGIPLGQGKGFQLVAEADDVLIEDFIKWYDSPERKTPVREKYRQTIAECRAELLERSKQRDDTIDEGARLEKVAPAAITLTHDPASINRRFDEFRKIYRLVAPATHVDILPEGFGVSIAFVVVDTKLEKEGGPGDVYPVGGKKVGIAGHIIQQIGAGLAIDWDNDQSRRLDNGSDPHYCHFLSVGWIKNFDGTPRAIGGHRETDAREGSDLIKGIRAKAAKQRREHPDWYNDDGAAEIEGIRKHILSTTETKAQLRAIAKSVGIKRGYHPKELEKPFAIARLSFTGHSEDPELKRQFSIMAAQAALQGSRRLYGGEPAPKQLAAAPEPAGHAPPPLGIPDAELEGDDDEGGGFEPEPDDEPEDPTQGDPQQGRKARPKASKAPPKQEATKQAEPPADPFGARPPEPPKQREPNPDDDGR